MGVGIGSAIQRWRCVLKNWKKQSVKIQSLTNRGDEFMSTIPNQFLAVPGYFDFYTHTKCITIHKEYSQQTSSIRRSILVISLSFSLFRLYKSLKLLRFIHMHMQRSRNWHIRNHPHLGSFHHRVRLVEARLVKNERPLHFLNLLE